MRYLDTRDLAATARALDPYPLDSDPDAVADPDQVAELAELHALAEQIANQSVDLTPDAVGDALAEYGDTLIPDGGFTDYAREFAIDIGAIDDDARWPCTSIDWDDAADDLKQDFTEYEYQGDTYWGRA